MPAMIEYFKTDELWALDSLIVNPKLGYCDQEMLKKITFWWFGNITGAEGWALFQNFATVKSKGKLKRAHWQELADLMPVLKGKPLDDVAGNNLLPEN